MNARKTRRNVPKHFYDFIEIGTSDFNTLIQKAGPTTTGLSIEPMSEYLDRLPNKPHVKKINAAISNRSGTIDIYYVPDNIRKEFGLPSWMKGTNSIGKPHKTVVRYLEKYGLPLSLIHKKTVSILTLSHVFRKYGVSGIGFFKVDTEGHDIIIINALIDIIAKKPQLMPQRIQFESNQMSNKEEVAMVSQRLAALGYTVTHGKQDTYAELPVV